jgi:hypothetical protein
MKKKKNDSTRASALRITLAAALVSMSAILLALAGSVDWPGLNAANDSHAGSAAPRRTDSSRVLNGLRLASG